MGRRLEPEQATRRHAQSLLRSTRTYPNVSTNVATDLFRNYNRAFVWTRIVGDEGDEACIRVCIKVTNMCSCTPIDINEMMKWHILVVVGRRSTSSVNKHTDTNARKSRACNGRVIGTRMHRASTPQSECESESVRVSWHCKLDRNAFPHTHNYTRIHKSVWNCCE